MAIGDTTIVFDTSSDPLKASGILSVSDTGDLNTGITVEFVMIKAEDPQKPFAI